MTENRAAEQSRRQVLRKGIVLGGVAWAAPTVTAVSLTPANAAEPSGSTPQPSSPPKNPPSNPPKNPPSSPPQSPPASRAPSPAPTPTLSASPSPKPSGTSVPVAGDKLPDTGTSDMMKTIALGGATALGGAAIYAAARTRGNTIDGEDSAPTA